MRRILFAVLCLLIVVWATPWIANWWTFRDTATSAHWQPASPEIDFCHFAWPGTPGRKVQITAVRAPASLIHIATGATTDAAIWRTREDAIFAVNGGFFDENGASEGLRVSDGTERSPLKGEDWGVFFVEGAKARIVHTRDYGTATRTRKIREAVQCGPRLVVDGRVTTLKNQSARRTGIGIDAQGRVILAIADGEMPFSRWAEVWAAQSGLACRDAQNLDGGPSTQMSLQTRQASAYAEGGWPVPDAVVVCRKPAPNKGL